MPDAGFAPPTTTETFRDPLPGVPRIESPFFERFFGNGAVDAETYRVARDLNEKGYAVLAFPDPEIEARADRIREALEPRYDWEAWRAAPREGLRLQDAWRFDDDVRALATNAAVMDLLAVLYGRRPFPFQTLNFPVGTQQHYHSDCVHFSSMPERFMCGVWVALEDIDASAGPLIYYPGSHKWPVFTNEHIGHLAYGTRPDQTIYHDLWQALVAETGIEPERLVVKKGTALIWSANLLHGGDAQTDLNRTRWSQVTHYYFNDCAYYTPMWSDPAFGSILFRRPLDIVSGAPRASTYLGRPLSPQFQQVTAPRSGLAAFDAELYLAANPDVARAGIDPQQHYLKYGRQEGRPLRPTP